MTVPIPGRPRVAVVGDAMMDVSARIDADIAYASDTPAHVSLQPGGSGANTAAWMGAAGVPVSFVGSVGTDAFGAALRAHLSGFGVTCRISEVAGRTTGTCIVIVDRTGERTMFPDPGANGELTAAMVRSAITEDIEHVHLSGYTLLNPASRDAGLATIDVARERGITLSLDPSSAGPLVGCRDLMTSVLGGVDVLLANAGEAAVLVGSDDPQRALDVLLQTVPLVVIKLGAEGAMAATHDERVDLAALDEAVVDTTGAGDAFTAGFLPAWLTGASLATAMSAAISASARAVGRVGAGPPQA